MPGTVAIVACHVLRRAITVRVRALVWWPVVVASSVPSAIVAVKSVAMTRGGGGWRIGKGRGFVRWSRW